MEDASADPAERIKQQRRQLHKRLGLDGQMKTLLDTEDLVKDEDLVSSGGRGGAGPVQQPATRQAAELLGDMTGRPKCAVSPAVAKETSATKVESLDWR